RPEEFASIRPTVVGPRKRADFQNLADATGHVVFVMGVCGASADPGVGYAGLRERYGRCGKRQLFLQPQRSKKRQATWAAERQAVSRLSTTTGLSTFVIKRA